MEFNTVGVEDLTLYGNSCRLCLVENGFISIFAYAIQGDKEIPIQDVLKTCTNLEVNETDDLPKNICKRCFFELLRINHFIIKCKKSYEILQNSAVRVKQEEDDTIGSFPVLADNESKVKEIIIDTFPSDLQLKTDSDLFFLKVQQLTPYVCKLCSSEFVSIKNFKQHLKGHCDSVKHFFCKLCDKGFSNELVYVEHLNRHNRTKQYLCEKCGQQFSTNRCYIVHLRRHNIDSTITTKKECSKCHRVFSSSTNLKTHMLLHKEKSYVCDICGDKFAKLHALNIHYRRHSGEKPYACSVCQKQFAHYSTYSVHRRMHTGEKPYLCKFCGKTFAQKVPMDIHVKRMHVKLKTHECPFCEKKFADKGNLTVHIRIHTGERPHVCTVCTKGFYTTTGLKKHLRMH